jgi:hypothetical protein
MGCSPEDDTILAVHCLLSIVIEEFANKKTVYRYIFAAVFMAIPFGIFISNISSY